MIVRDLIRCWLGATVLCLALASPTQAQTTRLLGGTGVPDSTGNGWLDEFTQFDTPQGISGDSTGALYLADTGNHLIRNIHDQRDSIVTVAGTGTAGFSGDLGAATSAALNSPWDVFVASGGTLYVADTGNHRIRLITPGGVISTIAGTGVAGFSGDGAAATSAQLNSPTGVYVSGGLVYIADQGNHRIRRISGTTITTFAGKDSSGFSGDGGAATSAKLSSPTDVYADTAGNLYITDSGNHRIRTIAASDSTISTSAGTGVGGFSGDGDLATNAQLAFPRSVYVDTAGNVYITDRFNHRLRRVNTNGVITTLAGDGTLAYTGHNIAANLSQLASPSGVWLFGEEIYFTDAENHRVRWIDDDNVRGLSGSTTSGPGRLVTLLVASFTGDGATGVKGLTVTVSDLSTATGLEISDFAEFQLYESVDSLFSSDDVLLGTRDVDEVTIGSPFDIQATSTSVPASGVEWHYIVTTRFSASATEGHALRVGFDAGDLSTSIGGHGHRVAAADANSISLDIIATQMQFSTQPEGVISGNPLITQPVVTAVDDSGFVDGGFTDLVTLTLSPGSTGTLLQTTATAVAGVATFTGVTYVAGSDEELLALVAEDETGGAEGDLPTVTSNTISANSANDAPTVSPLNFNLNEDDSLRVPISAMVNDVDDSLETLEITFVSSHTEAFLDGLDLILRPEADFFGLDTLIIIATDPFGASASGLSRLTIKSINDAPVIVPLAVSTIDEDDTLVVELSDLAQDNETPFPNLTWSFFPAAGLFTDYDAANGRLSLWTSPDSTGVFPLQLAVTDENLAISTVTDTVVVLAVNDPPRFLLTDTTLARGDTMSIPLADLAHDVESTQSALDVAVQGTQGLSAQLSLTELALVANSGFSGEGWIVMTVTDPEGIVTADTLRVSVFTANPQAPVISPLPTISVEVDDTTTVDLSPFVSDPDHDLETLTATFETPDQGSVSIEALSMTYVAPSTAGTIELTLTVEDPDGESASASLAIEIQAATPLLSDVPEMLQIGLMGLQLFLDNFVTGADPEEVTWSAQTEGPVDVVIDVEHRLLRITPQTESRDGGTVTLFASSPRKDAADTILVTVANATPVVELPDLFVNAGESAQLLLDDFVTDDDPTSQLTWTGLALSAGLQVSVTASVRAVTLTTDVDADGEVGVVLTAADPQGATGSDTMRVTIFGLEDDSPDTTLGLEDDSSDTTLGLEDDSPDTTLGLEDDSPDTTIVDSSGTNNAPELGPFSVIELFSGGRTTLPLDELATDDAPVTELSWTIDAGAGVEGTIDEGLLEVRALDGFSGTTSLRLTATDLFGARGSESLVVEVSPLVDEPVPGDFGRDGVINVADFFLFADHLGLALFHPGWDPIFDLNEDSRVDFDDFFLFVDLYDEARQAPTP